MIYDSAGPWSKIALSVAVSACPALLFAVFLAFGLSHNVSIIEPGLAYRSGQLWPNELVAVVEDYHIRSIISLVPPEPGQDWYREARKVAAVRGLTRYEMPLSSRQELTPKQLVQLVALLRSAPKPVLIQSNKGADRGGLAAALFEYAVASRSVEEAYKQLSLRYGHLPAFWNGTEAMDISFKRFVATAASVEP